MNKICPKCNNIAGFNARFQKYVCKKCGEVFNNDVTINKIVIDDDKIYMLSSSHTDTPIKIIFE